MTIKDDKGYCTYPVCMALKKDGYDRWCDSSYTAAFRYNGEDIDFETELDLKAEGKDKLIKRFPGEAVLVTNSNNMYKWMPAKDCARVSLADAMAWLREKHMVHISIKTVGVSDGEDGTSDRWWCADIVDFSDKYHTKDLFSGIRGVTFEDVVENALARFYNIKPKRKAK